MPMLSCLSKAEDELWVGWGDLLNVNVREHCGFRQEGPCASMKGRCGICGNRNGCRKIKVDKQVAVIRPRRDGGLPEFLLH
jgi:hypothetical protein